MTKKFLSEILLPLLVCIAVLAPATLATANTLANTGSPKKATDFPQKGRSFTATHAKLEYQRRQRTYLIQTLPTADRAPIVILLHAENETAEQAWRETSLPTLGLQKHFIVVAPDGLGMHWSDGRGQTGMGHPSTADDVGFLKALIAAVVSQQHGDPDAVFMIGIANGGFMTIHFACQAGEVLLAAGTALASLTPDEKAACSMAKPLPWLMMNGTADPLDPFYGQKAGMDEHGNPRAAMLSAADTFDFFASHANCAPEIQTKILLHRDDSKKTSAEKHVRMGCVNNTTSVEYVFKGGGHFWPGENTFRNPSLYLGGVNADIDAGTAIWSFFDAVARATLTSNH